MILYTKVECPTCCGTGYINDYSFTADLVVTKQKRCLQCNGYGYKIHYEQIPDDVVTETENA